MSIARREKAADKLDYALFMALEEMRVFRKEFPRPFEPAPFTGDDRAGKAFRAAEDALNKLRHYYVRPLMDAKKREESA